ncbi:MAG: PEP-CTERM sorting domain-containing protein [Planctomycetota bacterium]
MGVSRGVAAVAMVLASGLWIAGPGLGQGINPKLIARVPDWNQPEDYGDFDQPPDGPPGGPPGKKGVYEWCSPTAAANVMGWFEDTQGANFDGLGDGFVYPNAHAAYPDSDTQGNGNPDGLPDWRQGQWHDGTIEMGFDMDTQGWLTNNPNQSGTKLAKVVPGLGTYLAREAPTTRWSLWNRAKLNPQQSWTDYLTGGGVFGVGARNGVQLGDPVLVHWDAWIDPTGANTLQDDKNEIVFYDWTAPTTGIGHTVTGIGLWTGDPDGSGPLPNVNWMICHDNWPSTGHDSSGHLAVPWTYTANNQQLSYWQGNTHLEYLGEKPKITGRPGLRHGYGIPSGSDLGGLPSRQWTASQWTCEDGLPVAAIHWWGSVLDATETPEEWAFRIFEPDPTSGLPGAEVWRWMAPRDALFAAPTAETDANDLEVYEFFVDIPVADHFDQSAGGDYWLAITPRLPSVHDAWAWHSTNGSGMGATFDGQAWQPAATGLALELLPPDIIIPEPATGALLGVGLAAIAARRRRRRARS